MAPTEQTDGTVTLPGGIVRSAVRYSDPDGTETVCIITAGARGRLHQVKPEVAATFVSDAQAAARRDEDDAFERVAAKSDEWATAYGLDG